MQNDVNICMRQTGKIGLLHFRKNGHTQPLLTQALFYFSSPTDLQRHLQFSHLQEHVPSMTKDVDMLRDQKLQTRQETRQSRGTNGKPKPCYLDSLLSIHNQIIRMTLLYHVLSCTVIYCHASHMYPYTLHWDVHLSFTLTSGRILSLIGVLLCTCLATLGSLNKSRSSRDAG